MTASLDRGGGRELNSTVSESSDYPNEETIEANEDMSKGVGIHGSICRLLSFSSISTDYRSWIAILVTILVVRTSQLRKRSGKNFILVVEFQSYFCSGLLDYTKYVMFQFRKVSSSLF